MSEWLQKSLSHPDLAWGGISKGRLMTHKHMKPRHQPACFDGDPSAHFSLSLDSAFVELTLQWELAFVYFYPLYRTLKPTFPLCLNKVLVLHDSEKAANCCHPLNWNKDLIIIFFEKVVLSIWTPSSSHPCYWSVRNAMYLTHFLLGCVLFEFILKWCEMLELCR